MPSDPLSDTPSDPFATIETPKDDGNRPPEAMLVEVVPAPPKPVEPPKEEVHEIPDWLKPLPKSQRAEAKIEAVASIPETSPIEATTDTEK
jgi:hypothetical protein